MAKKKALPALAPVVGQPYPAPENWRWVRLGMLLQSSTEKMDRFSDLDWKYVGLEHMQKDSAICFWKSGWNAKYISKKHEID